MARLRSSGDTSAFSRRIGSALCVVFALGACAAVATGCGDDDDSNRSRNIQPNVDAGGGGEEDAGGQDIDDLQTEGAPVSVETVVTAETVAAGSPLSVDCRLYDAHNRQVDIPEGVEPRVVFAPQASFIEEDDASLVPTTAGEATVACQFADLSLVDDTPAELTIEAGPAHTVVTILDSNVVTAGQPTTARCEAFDAYGNELEAPNTDVSLDASGAGIDVSGHTVSITKSGVYTVACTADGATEERGAPLEVNPALPAALAVSKVPDHSFYDTGQVVDVAAIVTDEYGNRVDDAHVAYVSNPNGHAFGHGRFRYEQEGTYTVTATVDADTKDDVTLEESVEIVVNGQGPNIECLSPADGAMQNAAPGDTVTFHGRVDDAQGVDYVTVNDNSVSVAADGTFQHDITVRFGVNFVDIQAADAANGEFKEENSTTCAFLTADEWGAEDQHLSNAVSLWVDQQAVDDANSGGPLDSLNDVLHTVLNSDGLRDQIHQALLAQNPLATGTALLIYNYRVIYQNSRINGPHDVSLDLIPNGLSLHAVLRDVEIDLRETSLGINATADVSSLTADMDATLDLHNGRPRLRVRTNTVDVTAGQIGIELTGWDWLDDVLSNAVQPTLRSTVETQVEDFLKTQINDTLDDIMGGLDISSLGSNFNVPRLDGTSDLVLDFGVNFSSLTVDTARALFGLGTLFEAQQTRRATPSLGVPMPAGQNLETTDPNTPIAAAIHIGALNHVLHALWRGGLFDADIDPSVLGSTFPDGTEITLSTSLPPVAALQGSDKMILMLGGMYMSIVYPGLFDEPVEVKVGAKASTGVQLSGSSLNFLNINFDELYFSPIGITLDANSRAVLEGFLQDVLQSIVNSSLNNALPALPIPSFEIPASLGTYGLPAGSDLGIQSPALGGTTRHFILKGAFGVLP